MKNKNTLRIVRLWLEGAVLLVLRFLQLQSGFDPATGLPVPFLAGTLVWVGLLACLAVELVLCFFRPKGGKRSFVCCFQPPWGAASAGLVTGAFLMIAGGALLLVSVLPPRGAVEPAVKLTEAAAGVLGAAGGAGLLLLNKRLQGEGKPPVYPLLPAMFFSVLFVLSIYFREKSNPVLERYYLIVLASVSGAYFLYRLSEFFRGEGSLRWFGLTADLSVVICIAAAADFWKEPGRLLVDLSFAVTATVLLSLLRAEPLAEPEEEEPEETEEAGDPA